MGTTGLQGKRGQANPGPKSFGSLSSPPALPLIRDKRWNKRVKCKLCWDKQSHGRPGRWRAASTDLAPRRRSKRLWGWWCTGWFLASASPFPSTLSQEQLLSSSFSSAIAWWGVNYEFWVSVNKNQRGKSDKCARKGQERSGSLPPTLWGAIGKSLDFFSSLFYLSLQKTEIRSIFCTRSLELVTQHSDRSSLGSWSSAANNI